MNKFLTQASHSIRSFAKDEEGAQVVEYALIIALVSIILAVALSTGGLQTAFGDLIARVTTCMKSTSGSC